MPYDGLYATDGFAIAFRTTGQLTAALPGVPAGYEAPLTPVADHHFRLTAGPFAGADVIFEVDETGAAVAARCGPFTLGRVADDAPPPEVPERLWLEPAPLPAPAVAAFAALWDEVAARNDGGWIDYDLPYPKHQFVQYVAGLDTVIFHGSPRDDITTFAPRRTSIELKDETGRGNLAAVYGTHDGIWPMFFAVVDRSRLRGSIRNGVLYFQNAAGETLPVYNFSINREQLADEPWRAGTLYILPRATFVRQPMFGDVLSNEWASPVAVDPIAKLALAPQDFPFLDRIGGHDDAAVIAFSDLNRAVLDAVTSAAAIDGGYCLTLPWNDAFAATFDEFLAVNAQFVPAATYALEVAADGSTATVTAHIPPAMGQMWAGVLGDRLVAE